MEYRITSLSAVRVIFLKMALLAFWPLSSQPTTLDPSLQIGLPYIQNFTPADYNASHQNYDITQDQQGLMYFANDHGVLQFDGSTWRLIPLPNGATVYSVKAAQNGLVYVGGVGHLGWLQPDETGNLQFVSLLDKVPAEYRDFTQVWIMLTNGPFVFFSTDKYFFRWRIDGTEEQMTAWPFINIYHICHVVKDEVYVWQWDIGLQKLAGDSLKLVPGGEAFAHSTIRMIAPLSVAGQEKLLIGTIQKGFATYDGKTVQKFSRAPVLAAFIDENIFYNSIRLHDGTFALATYGGGIAFADQAGNLIQLLDKTTGLQNEIVSNVFVDQQDQLWLALNNGISRVEIPAPFTYYADELGLSGDVRGVIFRDDEFYAYGSSGFFPMTKPSSDDYRTSFQASSKGLSLNPLLSIISWQGEIIAGSSAGISLIDAVNMQINADEVSAHSYTELLQASRFRQDLIYAGMRNTIGMLRRGREKWELIGKMEGFTEDVLSIAEVSPHHLWVTTTHHAVQIKIEAESFGEPSEEITSNPDKKIPVTLEKFDQANGFPQGRSSVHTVEGKMLFATAAGFRKFNPSTNSFEPDLSLPYSDTTRAIVACKVQPNGDIWFVSAAPDQSELVQLKRTANGKYLEQAINFQPILTKGTSIYGIDIDPADSDIAWISTSAGLIKYHTRVKKEYDQTFPTLVRKVIINGDSLLFGGTNALSAAPVLAFTNNSMRFEYAAPTYDLSEKNRFQVWLEGFDKGWSNWTAEVRKDYTNLPEGDYTFRVKARNVYGVVGEEGHFTFSILPPWYRSWWAYLIYLLLLAGAVYGLVRWRVRQLKQRTLELEVLVSERTKVVEEQKDRLQEQAERLQELDKAKSRFFTNISHEFRTPLTIISGAVDQVQSKPDTWLEKGTRIIKQNTLNLLNLINQILDLRKLEAKSLTLSLMRGDIIQYLRYLQESYQSYAENEGLQMHFLATQPSIVMDYDPDKILRIVSNLLSNAIKYNREGGHIYFRTEQIVREDESEWLRMWIQDTGEGIPAEKLSQIFTRFYQVNEPGEQKVVGSGIGLALTYELVQLMQGKIEVQSEVGVGTTFTVLLPISRTSEIRDPLFGSEDPNLGEELLLSTVREEKPASVYAVEEALSGLPHLLIVEDNPQIVQVLIACLEDHYQLTIAVNGREGIDKAIEQIPDLIVSDVMMPEKDGYELTATLKADARTDHIPILLLTAKSGDEARISGLEKGADAYLTKPFEQRELLVRLHKLLELRRKLQAHYSQLSAANGPTSVQDPFLQELCTFAEAHLSDPDLDLKDMYRSLGMSRSQLFRKLKALTGKSASAFIRSYRLQKGKQLLATTDLTVSEVAYEVGFTSLSYFSRTFQEEFGFPPSEVKNS